MTLRLKIINENHILKIDSVIKIDGNDTVILYNIIFNNNILLCPPFILR